MRRALFYVFFRFLPQLFRFVWADVGVGPYADGVFCTALQRKNLAQAFCFLF